MKKLIILTTLLVVFGLTQFSAQITFSNNESDWLARKIVQNKILVEDSIRTHYSLIIADSTIKVINLKFKNLELESFENLMAYENCKSNFDKIYEVNLKLENKNNRLKKVLVPTIIISIIKTGLIVFVIKNP